MEAVHGWLTAKIRSATRANKIVEKWSADASHFASPFRFHSKIFRHGTELAKLIPSLDRRHDLVSRH